MSADVTSPKEVASLLRLVAAALECPDNYSEQEINQLIEDCDAVAASLYPSGEQR